MIIEELNVIMPRAGIRANIYLEPLNIAMEEFGINTPLRQAAFLAQVAHESSQLRFTIELASGNAYNNRADLGNTDPQALAIAFEHGSTPGQWWKGHGLIQITGFYNHKSCGAALGIDLLHSPRLISADPMLAARSAGWFWKTFGLSPFADSQDFDGVSDLINRGRKTSRVGDANGFTDRLEAYERAKLALGCNIV